MEKITFMMLIALMLCWRVCCVAEAELWWTSDLEDMATVTSATSAGSRGTLHAIAAVAEAPAASSWPAAVANEAAEAVVADRVCRLVWNTFRVIRKGRLQKL